MKYQVCRSQHPGVVQVVYPNLEHQDAIKRCQSLIDEAAEIVPTYFVRKQWRNK